MNTYTKARKTYVSLPVLIGTAVFAALAMTVQAPAQQSTANAPDTGAQVRIKRVPIKWVAADDGQKMYVEYCAACHGAKAKGDGPAAPALEQKPTDLTMLAVRNNGRFPRIDVKYALTTNEKRHAPEAANMPTWCPAFRSLDRVHPELASLRAENLVRYLESLQVSSEQIVPTR